MHTTGNTPSVLKMSTEDNPVEITYFKALQRV